MGRGKENLETRTTSGEHGVDETCTRRPNLLSSGGDCGQQEKGVGILTGSDWGFLLAQVTMVSISLKSTCPSLLLLLPPPPIPPSFHRPARAREIQRGTERQIHKGTKKYPKEKSTTILLTTSFLHAFPFSQTPIPVLIIYNIITHPRRTISPGSDAPFFLEMTGQEILGVGGGEKREVEREAGEESFSWTGGGRS